LSQGGAVPLPSLDSSKYAPAPTVSTVAKSMASVALVALGHRELKYGFDAAKKSAIRLHVDVRKIPIFALPGHSDRRE